MTDAERIALEKELADLQAERDSITSPSVGADVAKSLAVSPAKAIAGFAGMPRTVQQLGELGRGKLDKYLPDWMRNADAVSKFADPRSMLLNSLVSRMPSGADIQSGAESLTGKWHEPQTGWGKAADVAGQTATTFGRNLFTDPKRAASIIAGITGGTEAGGALTQDSGWGRFLGGMIGGGVPAAAQAVVGKPGRLLKQALGNVTPEEIAAAKAIEAEAAKRGIRLAGTESLNRGEQFASAVAAHPAGWDRVSEMFKSRVPAVERAVESGLLAQTGPRAAPLENAARAQGAASKYISDAERARTAATSPFYEAAAKDYVNPLPAYLTAQAEQARFPRGSLPLQNKAVSDWISRLAQPESSNARVMDQMYREVRDTTQLPAINATPEQKTLASALGGLEEAMRSASAQSPNIARGRRLHKTISENVVDPLYASPLGRMAGKSGFNKAEETPLARVEGTIADPKTARPETIKVLHQQLNGTDPQAFPGVAQTWIENALDKAGKDLVSGPSWTAGAKLANAITGTKIQKDNFREIMRGVAEAQGKNPDDVVKGAETLMEVLRRTGRTPGMGSQTHSRGEIAEELGSTLVGKTLSTISLTPTRPLARSWDKWIKDKRYTKLAEALTQPNSVDALVKMARLEPSGLTAQYYAATLLGLDRESK